MNNERSTQIPIPNIMKPGNTETYLVFVTVLEAGKFYSNQTGRFPVRSRKGKNLCSSYILMTIMKFWNIPSRVELERVCCMHAPHVLNNSITRYLSLKSIGLIKGHKMPSNNTIGTRKRAYNYSLQE